MRARSALYLMNKSEVTPALVRGVAWHPSQFCEPRTNVRGFFEDSREPRTNVTGFFDIIDVSPERT